MRFLVLLRHTPSARQFAVARVKMAAARRLFEVGDFAYFQNKLVIISQVRNVLNFNLYTVMDSDDGRTQEVNATLLRESKNLATKLPKVGPITKVPQGIV